MRLYKYLFIAALVAGLSQSIWAQEQKIGFYESDYILQQIPEYEGIQQQLDLLSTQWKEQVEEMENEIQQLQEDYEAKEILYTDEIRNQKKQEIAQKKRQKEQYLAQKFGPEGEYFSRQRELLEPIQRQVFTAVRAVAQQQSFDFVFDRSGDIYMVYANNEYNLNDDILLELGIEVEEQ
ncbi:MAG: OmpH family outer membrane protein [Gracilimonas sp.]|uniref:OmpH family outer membrane protein n=1 Tax=Gracilimonas TaxID=649462 RepID=UPI001B258105|nr:OmpH family outer membrane protein [Gracilimonas sp.]MBO6586967.1 OmpH family outer membrane protein [Gracilimonas sp.]MBO6614545.1 OmpH family outer membrane protein [Gracilimonas sp.]